MGIKKIVFKDMTKGSTYLALGGVRFYDELGEMIEISSLITNASVSADFENVTITSAISAYSSSYYPSYGFNTTITQNPTTSKQYWLVSKETASLTVEFKDGFMPRGISKIDFNRTIKSDRYLKTLSIVAYTEDDVELGIYEIGEPTVAVGSNTVETIETPVFMPEYEVNSPQLIVTTDNSMATCIEEISSVMVVQTEPDETKVRYAFSFDDRVTWFVYRHDVWSSIKLDATEIDSNGMTAEEVANIPAIAYNAIRTVGSNFNYAITLSTSNIRKTPSVSHLEISCISLVKSLEYLG